MNIESVKSLFELFSGEEAEEYAPFVSLAVRETERMLLPDADTSDIRLDFLAAAIANYRFCRMKASRDRTKATYAGKMLAAGEGSPVGQAAELLREYTQLCSDLIKPQTFVFAGFSGEEDEIC
ncbi:MAG: hypothetical protein IKO47_04030 [Ruminococcus sp.]|nr:hypothetical protein [Ruminococcus sp.]